MVSEVIRVTIGTNEKAILCKQDGRKGLCMRDLKVSTNELFHLQGGFDLAAHAVVYEEK